MCLINLLIVVTYWREHAFRLAWSLELTAEKNLHQKFYTN